MLNNFFLYNRSVYEIMWKSKVEPSSTKATKWRMRFTCWITKATDTGIEYVIFIALPGQKWLSERTSMLDFIYISFLVF
jgi:hypothetical protein